MPIIYETRTSSSSYLCQVFSGSVLQASDGSRRNLILWEGCAVDSSHGKRITTHLQLTNQSTEENGGLVLNYHLVDPYTNPRYEYFLAQINRVQNRVELWRYNGNTLILENFVEPGMPFTLDDWYQLVATTTDLGGTTQISVSVSSLTDGTWPAVSFSFATADWGNPDGSFGLHTKRAVTNFSFWKVENA